MYRLLVATAGPMTMFGVTEALQEAEQMVDMTVQRLLTPLRHLSHHRTMQSTITDERRLAFRAIGTARC